MLIYLRLELLYQLFQPQPDPLNLPKLTLRYVNLWCEKTYNFYHYASIWIDIIFQNYLHTSKEGIAQRKYQCKHCPMDFETSEGLSIHIANSHDVDATVSSLQRICYSVIDEMFFRKNLPKCLLSSAKGKSVAKSFQSMWLGSI